MRLTVNSPEMDQFAQQCTSNLKTWETRSTELRAAAPADAPDSPTHPMSPSRLPEDFFGAFPLTLPTHLFTPEEQAEAPASWFPIEASSSSSEASSEYSHPYSEALPVQSPIIQHRAPSISTTFTAASPLQSPSESIGSFLLSPRSDISISYQHHRPSSAGSTSSFGTSDARTSMQAAYQASVRKKRSLNRNSWNVSRMGSGPPPPPVPQSYFGPDDPDNLSLNIRDSVPPPPVSLDSPIRSTTPAITPPPPPSHT